MFRPIFFPLNGTRKESICTFSILYEHLLNTRKQRKHGYHIKTMTKNKEKDFVYISNVNT